jgi:hypothetical protein
MIQALIDEKILIGKKLLRENEGLKRVTFEIVDLVPERVVEYAKANSITLNMDTNKIVFMNSLHVGSFSILVFCYSKPVKITNNFLYEIL